MLQIRIEYKVFRVKMHFVTSQRKSVQRIKISIAQIVPKTTVEIMGSSIENIHPCPLTATITRLTNLFD